MAKLTNSPRQTLGLDLERRKSFTFQVTVVNSDGSAADLTDCKLRFVMKSATYDDDHYDITNIIVNSEAHISEPEAGYGVFSFQAAELDQPPGEYYGSITLWTASGYSVTLLKTTINLLENTESDSMHLSYNASSPPSEVEIQLRGSQVVNITTSNYRVESIYRGPAIRTTTEELNPVLGQITDVPLTEIRAAAYPNGKAVELRDGDVIFQEGAQVVAGIVMSIDSGVATVVTRISVVV